jgi:hypothetical protein
VYHWAQAAAQHLQLLSSQAKLEPAHGWANSSLSLVLSALPPTCCVGSQGSRATRWASAAAIVMQGSMLMFALATGTSSTYLQSSNSSCTPAPSAWPDATNCCCAAANCSPHTHVPWHRQDRQAGVWLATSTATVRLWCCLVLLTAGAPA